MYLSEMGWVFIGARFVMPCELEHSDYCTLCMFYVTLKVSRYMTKLIAGFPKVFFFCCDPLLFGSCISYYHQADKSPTDVQGVYMHTD